MDIVAIIISILSFILSVIATIVSCSIANKPYYKKLYVSETYPEKSDQYGFSISNMDQNEAKYPVEKAKGKNDKYTEL